MIIKKFLKKEFMFGKMKLIKSYNGLNKIKIYGKLMDKETFKMLAKELKQF